MDFEEMNARLRAAAERWVKEAFEEYLRDENSDCDEHGLYIGTNKRKRGMYLSCPFYMGVTEEYAQANSKRIMVIGQEARHYGVWKDDRAVFGYEPKESQEWAVDYLLYQLKTPNEHSRFAIDYNKSPFWGVFRNFKRNGINVCWNNVDKVYYSNGNKDYKGTLTYAAEKYLSKPYGVGEDEKSLLQREIEISNPDMLLFVTGPTYYESIAAAFKAASAQRLAGKLDLDKEIELADITDDLDIGIPAYWTYHPAYLRRKQKFTLVLNEVKRIIERVAK